MKYNYMYAWYFLCRHSKYSCGFLHTVKIFTWGLGFYNAIINFLFYFLDALQMWKNKYAKVK